MAVSIQAYYYIGNMDNVYTKVYDGSKLQANAMAYQGYLDDDSIVPQISEGSLTHVNEYGTMAYDETLGKNVGTLELHFDEGYPKVFRNGVDVTSEYNQTQVADSTFEDLTPGCKTFTIISRDVTLKSANLTKEYDGKALTAYSQASGTNVEDTTAGMPDKGYVSGEEFTYTFTGSQLFVGSSENTFTVSDSNTALTSDYNVTTKYGTLTVTQRTSPLTITITDQEKDYDGTATIWPAEENVTYTVTGDLAYNDSITVTLVNTNVDAGTYENSIDATYTIMHNNGDGTYTDVTSMYANVTIDKGDLTINKCNVTITSGDGLQEYNGSSLTNDAVTATGFIGDDGIATATVTGSQTEVGSSNNTFTYELKAGTKAENYDITTKPGTLVVTPVGATAVDPEVNPSAGTASVTLDAGETNDRYVQNVTAGTVATVTNESDKKLSVGAITANGDKAVVENSGTGSMDIARVVATKGAVEIDNDATMKIETLSAATDVTISNDGHLEANVLAGGKLDITNTSANTLIGAYTGETVNVTNTSTGKAENVTLQAYGDEASSVAASVKVIGEKGSTFTGDTVIVAGYNTTADKDIAANDGTGIIKLDGENTFTGSLTMRYGAIGSSSGMSDSAILNLVDVDVRTNNSIGSELTVNISGESSLGQINGSSVEINGTFNLEDNVILGAGTNINFEDLGGTLNIKGNATLKDGAKIAVNDPAAALSTVADKTLTLTGEGTTLTVRGGFTNNGAVALSDSAKLNASGGLANVGTVTMDKDSMIAFAGDWSNTGTITVDMTDADKDTLYTIVDYQGSGTMTLAGYGTVTLTNAPEGFVLDVVDNDLVAGYAVAQIGDAKYLSLESALAAAAESTEDVTIKVLKDTTLKSDFYSIKANLTITADEGVTVTLADKTDTEPRTQQALYFGEITDGEAATPYHTVTIGENVTLDGYDPQQTVSNWTPNTTGKYGYADIIINGKANTGLVVWDSDVTVNGEVHDKSDRALFQDNTVQIIGTGKNWDTVNQYESSSFQALHSDVTFKDTKAYFNAAVDHYADNVLAVVADIVDGEGTASATLDNAQLTFTNNLISVGMRYNRKTGDYERDSENQTSTLTMKNGSSITGTNSDFMANGTITIDSTSRITAASLTNTGSITLGYNADNALITVTGAFTGTEGTITVDMAGATEEKYLLIDGGEGSDYGDYKIVGGDTSGYSLSVEDNDLYAVKGVEPTPGKDYVVNSEWADKTYGDTILITKDDTIYSYTFGETAFSNVTGEDGVLTKIKPGKIITLYSDLSETGDFHIDKAYQVNLNGYDYTTTGEVYDSITIRNSTDSANTFTGGTLCTADYGYFSVNGINTAVFDTVKNAGGTVYLYTTAMLKTDEWINEEEGAKRGGRGEVYVFCPDLDETGEPVLTESFYKVIDQDSSTSLTISDYGWVGDDQGVTPSKGNYLWFYWKTGWEQPLPDGYKWATEDGDLVIIKYKGDDVPTKLTEQETADEITVDSGDEETAYYSKSIETGKDVEITANEDSSEMKLTGDVTSTGGDVTITDKGESLHITGDVSADGKTTIVTDGAADADATVLIGGTVSGDTVVIENKKESGASAVTAAGGFAVETLEIRNETSETLSASGKLKVTDIRIYNNDRTSETKVGTVEITDQIEAAGAIEITNGSVLEGAGTVDLGTAEHTAQDGLAIVNRTANVINGGVDSETGAELAANVTVASGDVTIENDGHINVNVDAANSAVTVSNTSMDTLITEMKGGTVALDNSGAIRDSDVTADKITLAKFGTLSNTSLTAGDLAFDKSAHQVVTFDWASDKCFTFTESLTNEGTVVIDAANFTGVYAGAYKLVDNATDVTLTIGDYGDIRLSADSTGYYLFAGDGTTYDLGDLYVMKDATAPTITIDSRTAGYAAGEYVWYRQGANAALVASATDGDSGLKDLAINGVSVESGASSRIETVYETGKDDTGAILYDTYRVVATDNAGNVSEDTSVKVGVDGTGPTIGAATLEGNSIQGNVSGQWIKAGTTATVATAITDELSGFKAAELEGSQYEGGKFTVTTLEGQDTEITGHQIVATDNVGNTSEKVVYYGVDGTGATFGAATLAGTNVSGEWIKAGTAFTVAMAITDDKSGFSDANLEGVMYKDGKFSVTAGADDAEIAEHTVTASDKVGNLTTTTVSYGIDGTGPTIGAAKITGASVYQGTWVKAGSAFAVETEITDAKSGLAAAELDGAGYDGAKFALVAGEEGDVKAKISATDMVGNASELEVSYKVDGTGPTITVVSDPADKLAKSVTLTATFTDSLSGLASAQYSFNGTDWLGELSGETITVSGITENKTVYFRATDNVGNVATTEFAVTNIVVPENPYVVDEVTRTLSEDLYVSDFSVIDGGVLDGLEGKKLSANNLYLQNGTVRNVDGAIDNVIAQSGANDISEMDDLVVKSSVTVESGELGISKRQYDAFFDYLTVEADGELVVKDAGTVSQKEIEKLQTRASISEVTFENAELAAISKLNFAASTKQKIGFEKLSGTDKADTITVNKEAQAVLTGAIDLGAGSDTLAIRANGQLVLNGTLSNVETVRLDNGATYRDNGSTYQKYTDLVAKDITFSGDRAASFTTGNYTTADIAEVATGAKGDTVRIGCDSAFDVSGTLALGAGTDTLTVGARSAATFGAVTDVEKFTVSAGKAATKTTEAVLTTVSIGTLAGSTEDVAHTFTLANYTATTVGSGVSFDNTKADTLSLGNGATAMFAGDLKFGAGNDTLKVGSDSAFQAESLDFGELDEAKSTDRLTIGSRSEVGIGKVGEDGKLESLGAISGANAISVAAGKAATKTAAQVDTVLTAGDVTMLSAKADTITLGNYTDTTLGKVTFGSKADRLTVGADATATFETVDFGTDGQTNQMTVGARSTVEVTDSMAGTLNRLTVAAGTVKSGTVAKTTLKAGGKVEGTAKADTISLGNYTDVSLGTLDLGDGNDAVKIGNDAVAIIDSLDFGDNEKDRSDSLTIGKSSSVTVNSLDVESLDKLTIGDGSTLYLGTQELVDDALAKFTKYDSNQIQLASVA